MVWVQEAKDKVNNANLRTVPIGYPSPFECIISVFAYEA
jgi:hypothetical protein